MTHTHAKNSRIETPRKKNNRSYKTIYKWHKRIGVTAALFLMWIVVSGLLLNHSDSLNMSTTELRSNFLAQWYGLKIETPKTMLTTKDHSLVTTDENIILDEQLLNIAKISPLTNAQIGMVQTENTVAIGSETSLILLDTKGHLIDTLNSINLPFPHIKKIGTGCNGIALQGEIAEKNENVASADGIEWKPCAEKITWSNPQAITPEKLQKINNLLIPTISVEKLIIDLHTGRFFGRFGPFVVDAIALCLMLLALSGLWMYVRVAKNK